MASDPLVDIRERAAIAPAPSASGRAPEGEPVAWRVTLPEGAVHLHVEKPTRLVDHKGRPIDGATIEPLFTAAPAPAPVPDDARAKLVADWHNLADSLNSGDDPQPDFIIDLVQRSADTIAKDGELVAALRKENSKLGRDLIALASQVAGLRALLAETTKMRVVGGIGVSDSTWIERRDAALANSEGGRPERIINHPPQGHWDEVMNDPSRSRSK